MSLFVNANLQIVDAQREVPWRVDLTGWQLPDIRKGDRPIS
ncbi:hypothetical protein [Funiculus sociatus]